MTVGRVMLYSLLLYIAINMSIIIYSMVIALKTRFREKRTASMHLKLIELRKNRELRIEKH